MGSERTENFLNSIYVVDEIVKDKWCLFFEAGEFSVTSRTEKGVRINGEWYPISHLATDPDGNLYVSEWLYGRIT